MQQTLLALLALMVATFFSLTQMQSGLQKQEEVMQAEMKEMAIGVATQTLEVVRARAFDEKTIGVSKDKVTDPENDLTSSFPANKHCTAFGGGDTCDSIEDFNNMQTATVPFEASGFKVEFEVDATVRYVDENMQPTSDPTFRKEVVFEIQDKRDDPYIKKPIRFSEVLTYY